MSGSDAKRKRKEEKEINAGLNKRQIKEQEELAKQKKAKKRACIIVPIVAVVLVFIFIMSSSLPYTKLTAVKIGDNSFSAADFNYYYQTVYNNFKNMYSGLGDVLGEDVDLEKEMFDEEQTWADYFTSMALATMKETVALCEAAEADGFELSQEEQDKIDAQLKDLEVYLPYYGFSNKDQYYSYSYGKGMNEEIFRRNVEMLVMSDLYGDYVKENKEFSDAEIEAEYQENLDGYNKVIYRYYYIDSGTDADTEAAEREAGMNAAKESAESFAAYAKSEEKFIEKALELMEADESKTETEVAPYRFSSGTIRRYAISGLASSYSEWLTDSAREYGDVAALEGANGYAVLFYIGSDENQYKSRNIRQILVQIDEDGEDDEPGTALKEAWETAEGHIADWEKDGATEDAFAEIAKAYSYDTETYEDGGLMEGVYKGQMVKEVEDWVYDDSRKVGDVEIVESYDGLHIVMYLGENEELYWKQAARSSLQSDFYEEWRTELNESYTAEEKLGMKFTNK